MVSPLWVHYQCVDIIIMTVKLSAAIIIAVVEYMIAIPYYANCG
jgi:hypothetical protein